MSGYNDLKAQDLELDLKWHYTHNSHLQSDMVILGSTHKVL